MNREGNITTLADIAGLLRRQFALLEEQNALLRRIAGGKPPPVVEVNDAKLQSPLKVWVVGAASPILIDNIPAGSH